MTSEHTQSKVEKLLDYVMTDKPDIRLPERIYEYSSRAKQMTREERDYLQSRIRDIYLENKYIGIQLISKGGFTELSDLVLDGLNTESNYIKAFAIDTIRNLDLKNLYKDIRKLLSNPDLTPNVLFTMAKLNPKEAFPKSENFLFTADRDTAIFTAQNILYDLINKNDYMRREVVRRVLESRPDGKEVYRTSLKCALEIKRNIEL